MENYKILIDSTEFQQKVLDYIGSDEFDKMVDATVFKDSNQCKMAIIHGTSVASMLISQCEPFCIKFKDDNEEQAYKFACLYIGKTELYDRSLTDLRNPNDPTEAYIPNQLVFESNRYALQVHREITDRYGIKWKDIQKQINKHVNYSAQMWVDEYERLWCQED